MSNPRPHLERLDHISIRSKYQSREEAEKRANPPCACGAPAIAYGDRPYCAGCLPPER